MTINPAHLFQGRNALLVTKHDKEKLINPLLEESFGIKMNLASKIDTELESAIDHLFSISANGKILIQSALRVV